MAYRVFIKDKGTIGAEVQDIAVGTSYTDMLDHVVLWADEVNASLTPLHVQAVAGLSLYQPLQGWEATLPDSTRKFVAITKEDDDEQ